MNAVKYLNQIRLYELKINHYVGELEGLQKYLPKMADKKRAAEIWSRISQENNKKIDDLTAARDRILDDIHRLNNPTYEKVLYLHYVESRKFEDICMEMDQSLWSSHYQHRKALSELEKLLTESKEGNK